MQCIDSVPTSTSQTPPVGFNNTLGKQIIYSIKFIQELNPCVAHGAQQHGYNLLEISNSHYT
jgi:hypothetical protein